MSNFHSWLFRYACDAVSPEQKRINILREKLLEAEQIKAHAETELKLRSAAVDRLDQFDPIIGGSHQCPHCWITNGVRSDLLPFDSDTGVDWFRCKTCHTEMSDE